MAKRERRNKGVVCEIAGVMAEWRIVGTIRGDGQR
jgi:hypothetical protein